MQLKNCPICHKSLVSQAGKGCKLCGMPLNDKSKEFCSEGCRIKHKHIHKGYQLMNRE